jgi:hypothetical protein
MVSHFCKVIEGDARELAETLRLANETSPSPQLSSRSNSKS